MSVISLNVENKMFTYSTKLINILEFNSKRLSIPKAGSGESCIYYIDYDKDPFYLVIDDLKDYFKENDGNKYLTIIFTSKIQKMMYTRIWEKIKKVINKVADNKLGDYSKDYSVIKFDSNDVLPLGFVINIHS